MWRDDCVAADRDDLISLLQAQRMLLHLQSFSGFFCVWNIFHVAQEVSGPICFSQIPSKSARDSTKDSCLCFERLKTLFVALFQQRLEFIRKAKKVFGFVAFGAQFSFLLAQKKRSTEDQTGFVFWQH